MGVGLFLIVIAVIVFISMFIYANECAEDDAKVGISAAALGIAVMLIAIGGTLIHKCSLALCN